MDKEKSPVSFFYLFVCFSPTRAPCPGYILVMIFSFWTINSNCVDGWRPRLVFLELVFLLSPACIESNISLTNHILFCQYLLIWWGGWVGKKCLVTYLSYQFLWDTLFCWIITLFHVYVYLVVHLYFCSSHSPIIGDWLVWKKKSHR